METYIKRYYDEAEREELIRAIEGKGHVVLHDDHVRRYDDTPDGRIERIEYGVLTCADVDPRPVEPYINWGEEWRKAVTALEKITVIARYLGLE